MDEKGKTLLLGMNEKGLKLKVHRRNIIGQNKNINGRKGNKTLCKE